ncbi:response regulator [Spongiivirga citrea]|uniref:Response regulator n=1 Tax=Spongiivirga citrea TaxID=1481457 RepID=A0A6M0CIK9_9FLAO|nr:response regulator transcription factor [Spongiivirga citrea]NER17745.1 response regulator [Spongiivirga citrea]
MITKIAITDDHVMVAKGIAAMLADTKEIEVVATYQTGNETLESIKNDAPDVLLLDINLPDINGIDLCKTVLKSSKDLKIIAITNYEDTSFVKRILKNGAHGYLLKNTDKIELLEAFKTVLSGEQYLQKDIQKKLLNQSLGQKKEKTLFTKLTRREKEVLQAISEELTTQEIADKLFVSAKTVETHRMNLMSKLGARNSVGLVKTAMELDLLD